MPLVFTLPCIPTRGLPLPSHLKQERASDSVYRSSRSFPPNRHNWLHQFPSPFSTVPSLLKLSPSIETGSLLYQRSSLNPIPPLVLIFPPFSKWVLNEPSIFVALLVFKLPSLLFLSHVCQLCQRTNHRAHFIFTSSASLFLWPLIDYFLVLGWLPVGSHADSFLSVTSEFHQRSRLSWRYFFRKHSCQR